MFADKKTAETNLIELFLSEAGFQKVDAYRRNPAVIYVRVIDSRFEELSSAQRYVRVAHVLEKLPEDTQLDITKVLTLAPSEIVNLPATIKKLLSRIVQNENFENPDTSLLESS